MAAPRKYPEELRERAFRLAVEARRDPATRSGALRRIGQQLGINPETLRNWVVQAEIDAGSRPGVSTDDALRIAQLERENRELRRANEILRTASAFLASGELDRRLKSSSRTSTSTATGSALEMGLWTRQREGRDPERSIHHFGQGRAISRAALHPAAR